MARKIEVYFCCKSSDGDHHYAACAKWFTDWFDFADWLKQETLRGPVLITEWRYTG